MENSEQRLSTLLRSKCQCIWIKSFEEVEVIKTIKNIIKKEYPNAKMFSWSYFLGMQKETLSPAEKKEPPKSMSPDKFLGMIITEQSKGDSKKPTGEESDNIWILKDFHLNLNSPVLVRAIRDVKERDKNELIGYNPLIIISPIIDIPMEQEKMFEIIDFDVPSKDIIFNYFKKFQAQIAKSNKYINMTDEQVNLCTDFAYGLTFSEIKRISKISMIKYNTIAIDIFKDARINLIKKTGILEYRKPSFTMDDMGGNNTFKNWVQSIKSSFSKEAEEFGVQKPKGCLMVGLPGTSKSVGAEIIANEMNLPLIEFKISKIMHSHVGQSEKNMENALKVVEECSPCLLLIDEAEKVFGGVASSNNTDGGTLMRVVGQLLTFLSSDNSNGIFTVFTSNNASNLPPELTRAGRIDTTWYFSLPTEIERKEIFKIHLNKTNIPYNEELLQFAAEHTPNFTGAEIKEIVKVAIRKAFNRYLQDNNKQITNSDIENAVPEIVPVYESNKETLSLLEDYYRTRARWANNEPIDTTQNGSFDEESEEDFDIYS